MGSHSVQRRIDTLSDGVAAYVVQATGAILQWVVMVRVAVAILEDRLIERHASAHTIGYRENGATNGVSSPRRPPCLVFYACCPPSVLLLFFIRPRFPAPHAPRLMPGVTAPCARVPKRKGRSMVGRQGTAVAADTRVLAGVARSVRPSQRYLSSPCHVVNTECLKCRHMEQGLIHPR